MLADELDYVIGVDTHRDEHVAAVVTAPAGAVVAGRAAPANASGYRQLFRVAEQHAPGRRAWAIEGTGSYGAGLARFLAAHGETVLEVSRAPRTERRLRGKDDSLDAARTARAALASDALALPRAGGRREALRLLLVARRSAVDVRREALTQLRAVIVTAPESLREELRTLPLGQVAQALQPLPSHQLSRSRRARDPARAAQPRPPHPSGDQRSRRPRTRDPRPRARPRPEAARPVRHRTYRRRPADHLLVTPRPTPLRSLLRPPRRRRARPRLQRPDHPAPAQPRRRPPTQPRPPHDRPPPPPARPATKDYIAKRIAEGKSRRDATRLLKRYLARHLYRLLSRSHGWLDKS